MTYKVVAVIWEDHRRIDREPLVSDPESLIFPTISFGVLIKKTKKLLVLVSDIERYEEADDATYTVIFRSTVTGIKEYGEIDIDNLRIAPNN